MEGRREKEGEKGCPMYIESQPKLKVCLRVVFPVYSSHPLTKKINRERVGVRYSGGK